MNRQTFHPEAILCSLVMIYGWTQAAASEPPLFQEGEPGLDPLVSSQTSSTQAKNDCLEKSVLLASGHSPNEANQVQWSRPSSHRLPQEIESLYHQQIQQSQRLAHLQQYARAVTHLAGIPKNSHHYPLVQQLQTEWSREILRQAKHHYQQARITTALATLNAIPTDSSLTTQVAVLRKRWYQQAKMLQRAIAAEQTEDWETVMQVVRSLENTTLYQSPTIQALLQKAIVNRYEPDATLLQLATTGLPPLQTTVDSTILN